MPIRKEKKERFEVPGTVIQCKSGRYIAFYEHRTDIIANGDSEIEVKKNLKQMYNLIKKNEEKQTPKKLIKLPPHSIIKSFSEKLESV